MDPYPPTPSCRVVAVSGARVYLSWVPLQYRVARLASTATWTSAEANDIRRAVHGVAMSRGERRYTRSGPKWQEKQLPRPTSLAMSRRAWCRLSTFLAMARHSPVPPLSRERLVDTR